MFKIGHSLGARANAQNWTVYVNGAVMLSAGLGLLVAYSLSLRFPPRLY